MDTRSYEDSKSKAKRHEGCNIGGCRFMDESSKKCIFETCLREELPPTQLGSIESTCITCGKKFSMAALSAFSEDRICPECRTKLSKLVAKCDEILDHIKHPLS